METSSITHEVARSLRPWVASDEQAAEFSGNFVQAMGSANDAFATAVRLISYRARNGWMQCGDIRAAAACVARRYSLARAS